MYVITATRTFAVKSGGTITRQVPAFYVDNCIDEISAKGKALSIMGDMSNLLSVDICAVRMGD